MPERIRRSNKYGSRMPKEAVYVGKATVWGNPYALGSPDPIEPHWPIGPERAVQLYRLMIEDPLRAPDGAHVPSLFAIRTELAGRDLACWCPLDDPCHADVLVELANSRD